jgi:hypothetical protein
VASGGITVFAARRRSAFREIESAFIEASIAPAAGADVVCCANPICFVAKETWWARGHREFWMPLLIRRDFSGLTLTFGKPRTLNSSVNRAFGTFVVFFTSN